MPVTIASSRWLRRPTGLVGCFVHYRHGLPGTQARHLPHPVVMANGNAVRPEIQFVEAVRDALGIGRTVAVGKNLRFVYPTRQIAGNQRPVQLSGLTGAFSETDHNGPLRFWRGGDTPLGRKNGAVEPASGEDDHENQ